MAEEFPQFKAKSEEQFTHAHGAARPCETRHDQITPLRPRKWRSVRNFLDYRKDGEP